MKQTALITGASSGIGAQLAELFARDGYDLVLSARNEQRLLAQKAELESKHGVTVTVMVKDLAARNAPGEVFQATQAQGIDVDVLVSSAGFGDFSRFLDSDLTKQVNMVNLDIVALMQMTHLFGNAMRKRGKGKILNVASIAGFCPGPYMSVYFASKAFVLSFSQAIEEELKGSGVTVTALCPGPTATNFEAAGNMGTSTLFTVFKNATAADVAQAGYRALMKGKPVVTHGFLGHVLNASSRVLPRWLMCKIAKYANGAPTQ